MRSLQYRGVVRALASGVCLSSMLAMTGCGGSGSSSGSGSGPIPSGHILISSHGNTPVLGEYTINASGSLTLTGGVLTAAPFITTVSKTTHTKKYVYVGSRDDAKIAQYAVSPSGGIAALSPAYVTATGPVYPPANDSMAVDATDNVLIYARSSADSEGKSFLSTFKIAPDGSLHEAQVISGKTVFAIAASKSGNNVYTVTKASPGTNITHYTVDTSTGNLTRVSDALVRGLSSPSDIQIDPTDQYLYLIDTGTQFPAEGGTPTYSGSVAAFRLSGDGTPTPIGSPLALVGSAPSFGLADAGGRLYISDFNKNLVFLLGVSGGLHTLKSYSVAPNPGQMTLDSTGAFLYVANNLSGQISEFKVASDGSLNEGGTIRTVQFPSGISLLP